MQHAIAFDVVRKRERHALGHAAENDGRRPGCDAAGRAGVRSMNSFEGWRISSRTASMSSSPLRQVSMRNEMTKAISSGNQPPSKSLVEVEAKNSRSRARRLPLTA